MSIDNSPPQGCDSLEFGGGWPSVLDGKCRCLVCGRCGHHTGNNTQGHYWSFCQATSTIRNPHFCCPDPAYGCEIEGGQYIPSWGPVE